MEDSQPESDQQSDFPIMRSFKTVRKNFAWLGICPELVQQSYPFNLRVIMALTVIAAGVSFVGLYVYNDAETFIDYTQSVFVAAAGSLVLFLQLILVFKVEKLFEFIDRCDAMLNQTLKYSSIRSICYEVNQTEEKLSKIIFFIMVELTPVGALWLWAIYIYFIYFTSDLGNEAIELPTPMWFPFDWKNPFGFFFAITIQYVMFSWGELIGACLLVLSVGAYLYGIATSKCIKGSLFAINRNAKVKANRSHLLEQFFEFLEMHSNAKQVISNFSDITEPFVTILFLISLVVMSGAMLMIQIQLRHRDNWAMLFVTSIESSYAFGIMLICCELAQRISLAFGECSEMVDQFDWYFFPAQIQRMLPLIHNFQQQPIEIKCFGSAACDRTTFKSLIKTAFSYFTVLREFYN